ncbi:MAG TPA: hypothetical protein VNY10_11820 [Roseiarcus sp.]|nr:hypothetical protein [Roseiarcus sp.]
MPPFPTDTQPEEDAVGSPDGFALGDTAHATSAAISASQNASAAPIAAFLATRSTVFLSAPFASGPCARRSGRLNVSTS